MGKMEQFGFGNFFKNKGISPSSVDYNLVGSNFLEKKNITLGLVNFALAKIQEKYGSGVGDGETAKFYHNAAHTKNVLESARKIAELAIENGNIENADEVLAEIAASFHDVVYETGSAVNEKESALLAKEEMARTGIFSGADLEKVEKMILATRVSFENGVMNQSASEDYLTKIIADADLSSLGQEPKMYWASAQALLKEMKNTDSPSHEDQIAWARGQVSFLLNHDFHTSEARELFPYKNENIEFVKQQIKALEEAIV